MYVNMCLKFCLYWTVKSNVFYSQKFENHGLSLLEKPITVSVYILSLAQFPPPKKKKLCLSNYFSTFESMASLDKQHELHVESHCNKTSTKLILYF